MQTMAYATFEDIAKRITANESDGERYDALLEDAAIIIDAYNPNASEGAKRLVSCNMVIRVIGSEGEGMPIGATQMTASALGYSQTWANANGNGELYLTKMDKKLLGAGNRIGFLSPYKETE